MGSAPRRVRRRSSSFLAVAALVTPLVAALVPALAAALSAALLAAVLLRRLRPIGSLRSGAGVRRRRHREGVARLLRSALLDQRRAIALLHETGARHRRSAEALDGF